MSDVKVSKDGAWVCFDGMTWPLPGSRMDEAEHRLRFGGATREDVLLAASVMHAYRQMVEDTAKQRANVVRTLRKTMSEADGKEAP